MDRTERLARSHRHALLFGLTTSALAHGLAFAFLGLPGPDPLGSAATGVPARPAARIDRPVVEPSLELVALRTEPRPARRPPPAASPDRETAGSPARPKAPAAPAQPTAVAADAATDAAPDTPGFSPLPAATLVIAGVTVPALADLDLAVVPTGTPAGGARTALHQEGGVMDAKRRWIAAAGGADSPGRTARFTVRLTGGGVCPVSGAPIW